MKRDVTPYKKEIMNFKKEDTARRKSSFLHESRPKERIYLVDNQVENLFLL